MNERVAWCVVERRGREVGMQGVGDGKELAWAKYTKSGSATSPDGKQGSAEERTV